MIEFCLGVIENVDVYVGNKNTQLLLLPDWSERADVIEGDAGGGLGESNDIIASEMIGWYC